MHYTAQPGSPPANPLLVFSSLLDWGEDGRYSPMRVLEEEEIRSTKLIERGHGLDRSDSDMKSCVMIKNELETYVMDDRLVKFAVSSVSKNICRNPKKRGGCRTKKASVVQHVVKGVKRQNMSWRSCTAGVGSVVDCKEYKMKRSKQEVSRNLFAGTSGSYNSSPTTTPHKLDQIRLPKDLMQGLPPNCRVEQHVSSHVPEDQPNCGVCRRTFSQWSSVSRHKQTGCCTVETASGTPRLGQGSLGTGAGGRRRRLQLEEGRTVLVWEPEDRILAEM
eukprot:GFUD01026607.1.p1 GENE.GFUD01026607.1~~GFUD01026607.1.p1  ORF type:complete len:276 (-),score=86.92 GFUD01026607.1:79-906(-)